jgi:hypothetical protein
VSMGVEDLLNGDIVAISKIGMRWRKPEHRLQRKQAVAATILVQHCICTLAATRAFNPETLDGCLTQVHCVMYAGTQIGL